LIARDCRGRRVACNHFVSQATRLQILDCGRSRHGCRYRNLQPTRLLKSFKSDAGTHRTPKALRAKFIADVSQLLHGRGCGVGRSLGIGFGLGVGVGRIVAVGVAEGVSVGVGVAVGVGVGDMGGGVLSGSGART
jgi:hypothetical protein